MTGINIQKERVVVSPRLIAPRKCCGESIDDRATAFKAAVYSSLRSNSLDPDSATKAMSGSSLGILRKGYEDTDGRKREFSADARPGVKEMKPGIRVDVASTYEPGKKLVLFPSLISQNSISTMPNMGWLDENPKLTFQQSIEKEKRKPTIQLTIYDVDKKTGEVKQDSAKKVDPFAPISGMSFEERQRQLKKLKIMQPDMKEKKLPGRSLGSRIPGGSLVARFAGRFGVLMDERNKFRCPPGTPAANQFTDMFGSNCFGFSGSRFARYAARQAQNLFPDSQQEDTGGFRNNAGSFFKFLYTGTWNVKPLDLDFSQYPEFSQTLIDIEDIERARIGRTVSYDAATGERVPSTDWTSIELPENMRLFKHGMANAQRVAAARDARVNSLQTQLGVDTSEIARAENDDLVETFEKLRELGLWDIDLDTSKDANTRKTNLTTSRMTPFQVREFMNTRLEAIPDWNRLSQKEKDALLEADVKRYYETERGLLESLLDQFIKNPAAARFLQTIEYDLASTDEAGTSFSGGGTRGPIRGRISINMANILKNQELMLPNLRPDQRLGVAAVGAATDAAGQEVVADFLVNANHAARRMAGLVGGPKTFAAFIGTHEFIHLYQGQAFLREAERKMQLPGGLEVPVFDRNSRFLGNKVVRSMDELTGADLFQLMDQMNDSIDVKDLDNALSKIENVRMLAGNYPEQYLGSERWALEASAEIGALREVGLIWGEDVDSALSFIDEARARPTLLNRVDSDIDADAADLDSTTNPLVAQPSGVNIPVDQMDSDQLDEYVTSLTSVLEENNKIERDELAEYLSGIDELPESNMIDEAALHLAQVDTINEFYIDPLSSTDILDDPNVDPVLTDLRRRHRDLLLESYQKRADISQKKHDELRKTWRKKYGVGTKGELDRFDQRVLKAREQAGLWTPEQARMAAQQISIDELTDRAKKISPDEIKEEIVRSTRLMPSVDSDSIQALELATGIEILKSEYVDRAAASGDKRSRARIMRDLEEMIEETISPKPKAAIKFKKVEDAKTFADKERARHRRSITKEQAAALREIGDFSESPIANMLSPELQVQLGRSMNRVAARRRRNNLSIDEKKANEADLQDQVKNILLPVLEAIDNSSVSESFEIEAMIDIDSNKIRGNAIGREIVQEGFVSGFVSNGKVKFRDLPETEQKNSATLKTGKKVIIRVKEGDRGIFPNIKDSKSQNFVMPPGSYTIVGRGEDNSLILEVSRQMDTVEVTDNLLNGLSNGYPRGTAQIVDDKIWRDGASRKIRPIVDQAILDMRSKGRVTGPASKDADSIKETNSKINGELADLDGYFGEGIFSEDGKFSSGSVGDDILGPRESKAQRTARRKKQIASDVTELRAVLSGRGSKKYPDLSADSIDPDTREMLLSLSTAELQDKVEEIGYRFHSGLDRRVRVRMRQEDIDELSRSGKFRSRTADSTYSANTGQRRVERLAGMEPVDRASRFSSGVVQNSAQLKERMEKENQIAKDATEIFDKIIKLESLDNLDEDEIKDLFGDSIKRSNITSVSETNKNVYEAADPATAIALMMAGHHATVAKQDLALTKQSLKQFQDIVEKGASERIEKNHPSWLRFKAEYAKENPREDLDIEETLNKVKKLYGEAFTADLCFLYDPEKNLLCSGHIGIEREKMPQLNGRTTGHDSAAIRMLKSGRAKGKWIKNGKDKDSIEKKHPKISKEESTEQYLSRLTSEGVDEKIIQDYRDSIKYDGIKSKHPAKGRDNPPLSEEDAEWFYANTNWTDTEVDLEEEFIEFAKKTIPPSETGESVISKEVIPSEYAPSQSQLLGKKVDDTNERMLEDALAVAAELEDEGFVRGSPEFREKYLERIFGTKENGERRHWWTGAILTTKDGFILDGHHRWAGLTVANMSLPEELQIPLRVNEFQTNIIEGLSLGKVFQDQFGIKEAKLKNENPWKEGVIDAIDGAEVDGLKESVNETAGIKLDELYEAGEFIKLGSVGLRNKPDYVEAVKERKRLAESRRPGPAARSRQRELSDLLETESRSSSGSFSSGGATPITKAQKTRKLEAVLDASLSRSNVNKKDKESIKFAVGLINSFTERRVSEETAEKIGAEILNRSGYDIAKLSLDEMASVGKIEKNLPQRILDKITSGEDRTPGFSSGADKLEQDSYPDGRFGSSSTARREEISSRAQKRIDDIGVQIEELESLNERLEKAIREFKATGTWEGEKYNVVLIEGNSPKTHDKDKLDRDEGLKLKLRQVSDSLYFNRNRKIEELKRDIKNLEGSKKRLSGDYPETTMLVDELLLDEDYLESVKARSLEVSSMSERQRGDRFTDPNDPGSVYVVHFGASKLEGGQLDPSRSRGQLDGSIGANTRQVNDLTARSIVRTRDSAKRAISILEEIKRQIETDGVVDFDAIGRTDPSDLSRADAARFLLGINRRDLDYNLPTLTLDVGRVVGIDAKIADENRTLSRLDKVADQLIADDYQYSSTYRARKLADAFAGYGGRYAEGDSTEWGDNAKRSTTTGIHIFKVKIGENATEENSVGETHLVGKHTPIASLVTDSDGSRDNPAREVWEGWLDLVIEQDIAKNNTGRSGFSSGADAPTVPAPPSIQLQPTESIDEAKRTGRPLSVLRPGTMPPKTQELYDTYLRQVGDEDAPVSLNSVMAALRGAISEEYEDLGFDSSEIRIIKEALTNHLLIKGNKQEMTLLGRGWSEEERFEDSVEILEKADIVIAVDSSILEKLITDGRFKTQFETKTSRGSLVPDMRQATDVAQLGYHPNVAPEMRPVYGYLTTGGTIDKDRLAGVKQYGDLQFVMKRGTHSRSTYTTNDSLQGGYTPSPMGVPSADAAQDKRTPGMYSEAQIHGGVSLEDVDYVVVNVGVPDKSYWQDNKVSEKEFESISGMLTKVGIRVVPVRDGEIVDVWNGGNIIPEPPADVVPEPEPVEAVA